MSDPTTIRSWVLSAVLLLCWLLLLPLLWPRSVEPVLQLTISKNRVPIETLRQRRSIEQKQTVWVDRLDLSRNDRFAHPRLGVLGYGEHFFVDLDQRLLVSEAGDYRFLISSDDGFALYVDDREVCSQVEPQPLTTRSCERSLSAGQHRLRLRYFQAGGGAGLAVRYGKAGDGKAYWLGEDSALIRFPRRD